MRIAKRVLMQTAWVTAAWTANAAPPAISTATNRPPEIQVELRFQDAPLVHVMQFYGDLAGCRVEGAENVPARVSATSEKRLTRAEALVFLSNAVTRAGVELSVPSNGTVRVRARPGSRKGLRFLSDTNLPPGALPPLPIDVASEDQEAAISAASAKYRRFLEDYQMEVIRRGLPALPIPLSAEADAQLVREGVLPPLETNRPPARR